ncbi:hypothetical protein HU200_056818 [Digitaria exilis]|uniref:Aminotransferase class V domain-containing protein n=1 Tax=Digitaria exilis TaxID=1010633 RepID=A0A835AR05_9POAL|nr:hypothetical protein HU200_056818 [Digitaria exilis]
MPLPVASSTLTRRPSSKTSPSSDRLLAISASPHSVLRPENTHPMASAPHADQVTPEPESGDTAAPAKRPRAPPIITEVEIRTEFAHHDGAVSRINNGTFGCCPASVLASRSRWQRLFLSQLDAFYFCSLQPGLARSRAAVALAVGAGVDPSEVSLVDNATTAAAIVMQHVAWSFAEGRFSRGDAVLMLHYTYSSVKKSIHAYAARAGATVVEVPLPFPVASPSAVAAEFRAALAVAKDGGRRAVRLAVIDHITSMPSVLIPVKELVAICREEGVDKVFVDAAHAIGQVPIDVRDIGADFYTSNLHKWFFCPSRGLPPHPQGRPHRLAAPPPRRVQRSAWIGVRDYSAQLVVPDAVDFMARFEGGIEGISRRNHDKVVEMGMMLAEAWGTFLGAPPEMCGSMAMIGLPGCLGIDSDEDAMRVRDMLRNDFKVEVPIFHNSRGVEGKEMDKDAKGDEVTGYVRISHQVYNVREEYEVLRDAVNKLVLDGFTCAKLRPSGKCGTADLLLLGLLPKPYASITLHEG